MKKLLLLILAFVAIATGSSAATDYGFSICGVEITSDNYQSMSSGAAWSYDSSTNVLHLRDGNITTSVSYSTMIKVDGNTNPSLSIQVDGECHLNGTFSNGILFEGVGEHVICGNGTLTMYSQQLSSTGIRSSSGKSSLTIKDVTINITIYGEASIGFQNNDFSKIVLDNCEMNIKTSAYAWTSSFGSNFVMPVLKKCFISYGYFNSIGNAVDSEGALKEVYIKRAISVVDITVDEPIVGNNPTANCTLNSDEYYSSEVKWYGYVNGTSYEMSNESVYKIGEYYEVSIRLFPKEGNRFSDKEDITAYVNGGKVETINNLSGGGIKISYTFPELLGTKYNLWIGGVQVNDANKDDVLGNGKVKYAPSTKTLSLLNGTTITGKGSATNAETGYGAGIYSEIDGLTIDVATGGVEFLGADECHGIYLRGNTTIKGESSILCKGYIGVFMGSNSADLTVDGKVALQAEGTKTYGLGGYVRGFAGNINYYTTLTIKGSAMVLAKGELGSVRNWKDLVLNNHAITSPAGAVWNADKHAVCDASGNPIAGEWVSIIKVANPYDLNGDDKVSTADIQVIINEMKKPQASQDMKYDLNNDGKISTADIQVIINEMKK